MVGAGLASPGLGTALGVDPQLVLLPDGILVLTWGWPDAADNIGHPGRSVHVAFSADGNGMIWTNDTTTFVNNRGVLESTGYTFNCPVGPNRLLQIADTGVNWSYSADHPSPNPFTVWGKYVDIAPANINRIDLKTKYALGVISVTTDLSYTNATHPEAHLTGAFDGSTDYWSGAFGSGVGGSFIITLDKLYRINALGICLHYNNSESANIYFSQDGTNWGAPVKIYSSATHNAISYTTLPTPILAKSVRVNVSGAGPLVCLNEIELYETSDTFENNAIGVDGNPHGPIPPGYTWAGTSSSQYGFAVRAGSTNAYQSDRALQLWDNSSAWMAGIKKTVNATKGKSLEFRIKPQAYAPGGGLLFDILGEVTSGTTTAYHFAIQPDGSLQYHNGTAWQTIPSAPGGTAMLDNWSLIRVDATVSPNQASLYVNGSLVGNVTMYANPVNVINLNGFAFNSSGTATVGDKALFDDVSTTEFYSPRITAITLSGSKIVVQGTNGVPKGNYYVHSSQNLERARSNWPVIATNQFDAGGGFVFSDSLPTTTSCFYMLRLP